MRKGVMDLSLEVFVAPKFNQGVGLETIKLGRTWMYRNGRPWSHSEQMRNLEPGKWR